MRDLNKIETPQASPSATAVQQEPAKASQQDSGVKVLVRGFRIESAQFSENELQSVVQDYVGREVTFSGLEEATRRISEYYRERNYFARAILPKQSLKDGIVKIVVVEGTLAGIKIDSAQAVRLDPELAKALVASRMPPGELLRPDDLREGVAVLNETPGVHATASLERGEKDGETVAVVKAEDTPLVSGSAQINNQSSRSVGAVRGIATLSANNAFGRGDQFSILAVKTSGSDYGRLSASSLVGTTGLTLGINGSLMRYDVDDEFNSADQEGHAFTTGLTASYPVIRLPRFSLTVLGGYEYRRLVNSVQDINSSNKEIHAKSLGARASATDTFMGGGASTMNAEVVWGHLDLKRNTGNYAQDVASAQTNGLYSKYALRASRLQNLVGIHKLFLSSQVQLASQNLDSSEQFSLGGPDGVRAYPVDEGKGDIGFLGRVELRHNVMERVQLFDFYDAGWIQQHEDPWSGWNGTTNQPNDYWLQGLGVGVTATPIDGANVSLTLAHTLGSNPGKTNGKNNDGYNDKFRIWVSAGYVF